MKNKKKKTKKLTFKERMTNIMKSYKTIIYISFIINIILLAFTYYILTSNKVYSFSGSDEYIRVSDGLIVLNTDINLINGNNIQYINGKDYDISNYKIGYYVMDDTKLVEIISNNIELDTSVKLSELINNFSTFNVVEKNNSSNYFTSYKKDLIDSGLYLVLEAKTTDGETVFSKVKLNVSKISKY